MFDLLAEFVRETVVNFNFVLPFDFSFEGVVDLISFWISRPHYISLLRLIDHIDVVSGTTFLVYNFVLPFCLYCVSWCRCVF